MKRGLKCRKCGNVIFSYHRHDFKECECGECFVDGGDEYFRYGTNHVPQVIEYDNTEVRCILYYSIKFGCFVYLKYVEDEPKYLLISKNGDIPVDPTDMKLETIDVFYRPNLRYRVVV